MVLPTADRDTFLSFLSQSGLVTEEQIAGIRSRFTDKSDGRSLARALVEQGVLTRFQADRLLMGRTAGFQLGPYRILDQLGRGGMGRVYKAEHRTMGRLVALKVLAPELLKTERAVQLFLREVRAVGQLVHPHIVTAFDANEAAGRYYLVLEFVDGPNLDQLVRRQGPLTPGLACDYIRQAASGLQYAHQRGMVHRDIKPANILVQRRGQDGDSSPGLVKVSDFGLARLAAPSDDNPLYQANTSPGTIETRANSVMGTPDYLSPEQSRSLHQTDIRSDIYSLGCTFYFLLTGQVPFPGGTTLEKLIRHNTERPMAIPKFRQDVPPPVLVILEKMIAKAPENRFQTPGEVADALQPYAVSGPTPWQAVKTSASSTDSIPPSPGSASGLSDSEVPLERSDEDLMAISRTMASAMDDTPWGQSLSSHHFTRDRQPNNQLQIAVITAISIIAGLIVLLAVLAITMR
ncbi:MAG: serine/threonine protein kinase [Planctomycetia bacterium]|nr:serine/threonine protein kinase [Planctomycetia bacterium]